MILAVSSLIWCLLKPNSSYKYPLEKTKRFIQTKTRYKANHIRVSVWLLTSQALNLHIKCFLASDTLVWAVLCLVFILVKSNHLIFFTFSHFDPLASQAQLLTQRSKKTLLELFLNEGVFYSSAVVGYRSASDCLVTDSCISSESVYCILWCWSHSLCWTTTLGIDLCVVGTVAWNGVAEKTVN